MSVKEIFNDYGLILVVCLLFSLAFHEYAHARVAVMMGDETPKKSGRLTLNPFKHLSFIGTLVFLVTQKFGWARPVPISFSTLGIRKTALVAMAGPLFNLALALSFAILLNIMRSFSPQGELITRIAFWLSAMVYVNCALFLVNLFPFPPLDGFRILLGILKRFFNVPEYKDSLKYYLLLDITGALILGAIFLSSDLLLQRLNLIFARVFGTVITLGGTLS